MVGHERLPILDTISMNDVHFDTILHINKLSSSIDKGDAQAVEEGFDELIEHTLEHSKHEEEMMIEKKFPPYQAHKEEHDLALEDMKKARAAFRETKDFKGAKDYIELNFTPWFLQHTETMDAVTSMFLENSEVHLGYWERLKPRKKGSF